MTSISRVVRAQPGDLDRYVNFLEGVADWLAARGITQWQPGQFRRSVDFYAESIRQGEVHLAFNGDVLSGTLRILMREPIVWPEIVEDDAVYVFTLAVNRAWAHRQLGRHLLAWAGEHASSLGRRYVRLDCMAGNAFLRSYYSQAGFLDRGEVDAHFPAPVGTLRVRRYESRARPPLGVIRSSRSAHR